MTRRSPRMAECHSDRTHRAKGLCAACYAAALYHKNPGPARQRARAYYEQHRPAILPYQRKYAATHRAKSTARSRAWKKANPERARAASRRWRERYPERAAAARRSWFERNPKAVKAKSLRNKYGLSIDAFEAMFQEQEGRCALCGSAMATPYVDHDHGSGRVRALLCRLCNLGLGSFKDNPELLRLAAEYVEWHGLPMTQGQAA